MNNKYYFLLLIPITAFIVVVVIGVWHAKKNSNLADQGIYDNGGEMPYIHPIDELDLNSREYKIDSLKEAVKKFRNAKTFRATISEDMPEGKMKGELAYMAPLRLQASLSVDSKISFEMIIVGETAYAKMPNDSWKMTNDEVIKKFGRDFFENLLNKDESLASFGIENESAIETKDNVREDCTEYRSQYVFEEAMYDIVLCVDKTGFIKFIKRQHSEGESITYYKEFNTLFTIERPMLPILDRTPKYVPAE